MAIVTVKALSFSYPTANTDALTDVSFALDEGSLNLLVGATGSGKSTLLRLLKPELAPYGKRRGEINYAGLSDPPAPGEIGFVGQDPNTGIVTDRVYAELAFAPELMGLSKNEVRLRVGETASYFGLGDLFERDTESLSGGEKQLLTLAAAAAADPKFMLLDEPTAMLDPIAADRFFETLERIRRDFGVTVLLAEHRFAPVYARADRVLALDGGRLIATADPIAAAKTLKGTVLAGALPVEARLWKGFGCPGDCPKDLAAGKKLFDERRVRDLPEESPETEEKETVLSAKDLTFCYQKNAPPAIDDLTLDVKAGEHLCVLGENGAGKTTLLLLLAGLRPPLSGKVRFRGRALKDYRRGSLYVNGVALLPQDPGALFLKSTVLEDLVDAAPGKRDEAEKAARELAEEYGIAKLLGANPLDLSGGEKQLCGLVKLLLRAPEVLLLDEPTKGLDPAGKRLLRETVARLTAEGKAVVTVTHDVEFAAGAAQRCAFLFRGQLLALDAPRAFFAKNRFYTPAASRLLPGALTVGDLLAVCGEADV
ncbi:MAG: ABC transporter ATP-binding protein [Clostridia bacterium]|nr:ABC transporter ATP-binding protein [Clostridia bacterium]